ncbi:MAG: ribonuclease R [Clostridia bacterium]|nr:ribonuclease R [Clostridia bacterium]
MKIYDKIKADFLSGRLAFKGEKQIYSILCVKPAERKYIKKILSDLMNEGFIIKDRQGGFATPEQLGAVVGKIRAHERGFAFLIPDNGEKDYFIPHHSLHGALNKDTVLAMPVRGTEDEAEVVKILERGYKLIVGTFEKDKRAGYVLPDDNKMDADIYIPLSLCLNAKRGDKVVAEITSFPHGKMPGGKIVEILGESGDFFAEELSIIRSFGLYEQFPISVEKEAEKVAREPIFVGERKDLRELFTITIDGEDTRDIDDAISLVKKGENFILGVHIADVSHYVKRGSKIDKEAYLRGTSVYFPDRVLPMLPKALSNGACSLNEGEERYALSCIITFDKNGNRIKSEICESVIKSDKRTTYHLINDIYEGKKEAVCAHPELVDITANMSKLCTLLDGKRKARGGVELDVKEAHIYLDENDELQIPDYERLLSHKMIEQFMVSANEAVAEKMQQLKMPFLYRVHERPSPEKASSFISFLKDLGINAKFDANEPKPSDFAEILKGVENEPYSSIISKVMLRSMQKARYCQENLGHFGLASNCYCHFTSPIRRYPDLFIHRVIKDVLHGESERAKRVYGDLAEQAAIDTSERERRADEAERAVDDLYKVVYMSERIGEEYQATISGVTNFGIFAELSNTIEGIIRVESLPKDDYEYFEDKFLLKGVKRSFRLGDQIKIRVDNCDYGNMRVEFGLVE